MYVVSDILSSDFLESVPRGYDAATPCIHGISPLFLPIRRSEYKDVIILKEITPPSMDEFEELIAETRRQARQSGMKRFDIVAHDGIYPVNDGVVNLEYFNKECRLQMIVHFADKWTAAVDEEGRK